MSVANGPPPIADFKGFYEGFNYLLGASGGLYVICLKDESGHPVKVISSFNTDQVGWQQAWIQFTKLEPNPKPYEPVRVQETLPFARKNEPITTVRNPSSLWSEGAIERPGVISEGSVNLKLTSNVKVKKRWDVLVVGGAIFTVIGIIARLLLFHYGRLKIDTIPGGNAAIYFYRYGSYVFFALGFILGLRGRKRVLESSKRFKGILVAWLSIITSWVFILIALFVDVWTRIHQLLQSL